MRIAVLNLVNQAIHHDYGDAPLGYAGNLAFKSNTRHAARATVPSMLKNALSTVRGFIAHGKARPRQRAGLRIFDLTRGVSTSAGALLGMLTVPHAEVSGVAPAARALNQLLFYTAELGCGEDVDRILAPIFERHLRNASLDDLVALRGGLLCAPQGAAALLRQLGGPRSHQDAAALVIKQFRTAWEREVATRVTEKPLSGMLAMFARSKCDAAVIDDALEQLSIGSNMLGSSAQARCQVLSRALENLTDAQLGIIAKGLSLRPVSLDPSAMDSLQESLLRYNAQVPQKGAQRVKLLDDLQAGVAGQIHERLKHVTLQASDFLDHGYAQPWPAKDVYKHVSRGIDKAVSTMNAMHLSADGTAAGLNARLLVQALAGKDVVQLVSHFSAIDDVESLKLLEENLPSLEPEHRRELASVMEASFDGQAASRLHAIDAALASLGDAVEHMDYGAIRERLEVLSSATRAWDAFRLQVDTGFVKYMAARLSTKIDPVVHEALALL